MKKFAFTFIALLAAAVTVSAMNLKEAFEALSNLPGVSIKAPDYNLPVVSDVIKDGRIAAAYNLDRQEVFKTGNAAFAILNQVPLSYMINGGCNNEVGAFIYSTPNATGTNDILIAIMSGYRGDVIFISGTTDNVCKEAIRNAPMKMRGNTLSIEADHIPDVGDFNIIISKAR